MIIIGLGNPGEKYARTRHNIGFRIIDQFAMENNFPEFKLSKKFNSLISESNKTILAKPQTFMNNSGKAIKSLTRFYKTKGTSLAVIHDDIDLPLGKIKIVKDRSSAGHKGVESIIREIGTKDFIRVRIGIKPKQNYGPVRSSEGYVLEKFDKNEEKIIKEVIKESAKAVESLISDGLEKTMSQYN